MSDFKDDYIDDEEMIDFREVEDDSGESAAESPAAVETEDKAGSTADLPQTEDKSHETAKKQESGNDKPRKKIEYCSVCHRPDTESGPLIHMNGNFGICRDCMQDMINNMMNGMNPGGAIDFGRIQNVSFLNLSDLQSMMQGKSSKVKPGLKKEKKPDKKEEEQERPLTIRDIPAPHRIKAMLDEYVVGQDYAKKVMSVGVYNHYKRILSDDKDGIEIEKSNMLMIGPTGCGKTYLVQTLAKVLDVPLAITDATSLTEAGYIGDDIESVVSKLLAAADNDVERAEHGIIFIDEIDKIAKKANTNHRDVSGESVQQGMLKLLEGSLIEVPVGASSKSAMVPMATVDTRNILFICGGAFPDLEEIIKERLNKEASIGFKADLKDKYDGQENLLQEVEVEDVRKYGMIPEFLGRLPILFSLDALTEEMMVDIMVQPKNAIIRQYQKLLAMDEVELCFDQDALTLIAKRAKEKGVGARALRSIIEEVMLDIMYEIPKDDNIGKVTITKAYVEKKGGPLIEMRGIHATPLIGASENQ
ncbi:MAG: ATP-dependent Clp protease ATP-binding subunit ClpX [Clostridiales bacterium]|nr:ATP-dependent Clp protease ATP-binding subunit ClpX [Clostridiales bacterium]